jgi:hypothetical protein
MKMYWPWENWWASTRGLLLEGVQEQQCSQHYSGLMRALGPAACQGDRSANASVASVGVQERQR